MNNCPSKVQKQDRVGEGSEGTKSSQPTLGEGIKETSSSSADKRDSMYGTWTTVVKPRKQAPKHGVAGGRAATPPSSQRAAQVASMTAKKRNIAKLGISLHSPNRSGE